MKISKLCGRTCNQQRWGFLTPEQRCLAPAADTTRLIVTGNDWRTLKCVHDQRVKIVSCFCCIICSPLQDGQVFPELLFRWNNSFLIIDDILQYRETIIIVFHINIQDLKHSPT